MKLSALRVALRIARRDALRAKGRSALVVAMIAIPVLGVTAADVTARSTSLSAQEVATRKMGAADAYVSVGSRPGWRLEQTPDPTISIDYLSEKGPQPKPTAEEAARAKMPLDQLLNAALPTGARLLPVDPPGGMATTSTSYGQDRVETEGVDLADPAASGLVTLRQGAWPKAPYEISATSAFLAKSGLKVGQTTTLQGTTQALTITAEIEFPGDLSTVRLVGRPGELAGLLAAGAAGKGGSAAAQSPNGSASPTASGPGGGAGGNAAAAPGGDGAAQAWLVALPGHAAFSWSQVQQANSYGLMVASRAVLADPPPQSAVPIYRTQPGLLNDSGLMSSKTETILGTVVGMALLEIVLLAGPAFAVGARRSRRQLGLIAAGGGDRAHIRGVVLGGGVVLGVAGAGVGMVLGAVAVALGRNWLETKAGSRFGGFVLAPGDLVAVVALGVVTGMLAAIVPAIQAARQNVVLALTGRGKTRPPAKWFTLLGIVAFAGGTALALLGAVAGERSRVVMAGSMLAELGLVACTPFLVSLFGRLSPLLPLGPRLALRDATRNRGRTAPAVAAVLAAVAGAVAVLIFQSSSDAASRANYAPSALPGAVTLIDHSGRADSLRSAVEQSIPGLGRRADLQELTYGKCDGTPGGSCGSASLKVADAAMCPGTEQTNGYISGTLPTDEAKRLLATDPRCRPSRAVSTAMDSLITGDATVLHNLLGVDDPAAVRALAAGKAVVFDPRFLNNGRVTLALIRFGATGPEGNKSSTLDVPGVAVDAKLPFVQAVLPASLAASSGLTVEADDSVWLPAAVPSSADEQRASAAVARINDNAAVSVERGYQASNRSAIVLGLAVIASVVAVAAAGIATGLASADSQGDLATLAAVGAAPGIRRRLSGFQCGVIAAMGAVMGVLAGFVPAVAIQRVQNLGTMASFDTSGAIELGTQPLVVPWTDLVLMAVGLPLLAWLLAAGLTRSRLGLTRRSG
ncbi:FtsX-like permease family protein [Streptacidiphilus sp. EB129]|uniref:FtsX-like permease family protein n=1 Tax=Streptacidiphilus sp. EB129 TaxID=3156262 RepID=UPI00351997C9